MDKKTSSRPAATQSPRRSADQSMPSRVSRGRKSIVQPDRADALERGAWAEIGRAFRAARLKKGLTLDALAEKVRDSVQGYIITPSQISRIESGRRDPGFFNTKVIARALGLPLDEVAGDGAAYAFYMFTPEKIQDLLDRHLRGELSTGRQDGKHELLIKENIYRPIPLERTDATDGNDAILENSMSINLLRVEPASYEQMMRPGALDAHDGEEVIYVIDGELEFFFYERPNFDSSRQPQLRQRQVRAGGCLHYSASGLHGFRAVGSGPALALYVASKPRAYVVKKADDQDPDERT